MVNFSNLIKITSLLTVIALLFACSASQTSDNDSIKINTVSAALAENRAPKENSNQVDLELNGMSSIWQNE